MKKLLGDFNANVVREDILKQIIDNENLHELINDKGFRVVSFPVSENLIVKSTTFSKCDLHKHDWTPDGDTINQIMSY
jgi:hypothetical protein